MSQYDCTIFRHRSMTVRLTPAHFHFVYLIHFARPLGNPEKARGLASHYLGSTGALEHRLERHRAGNGAALMAAASKAGIEWTLARLWRFDDCQQARAFERKMKKTGHNPRKCPICHPHQITDPYTFMRQGHSPILTRPAGKRRPIQACAPRFVRREVSHA